MNLPKKIKENSEPEFTSVYNEVLAEMFATLDQFMENLMKEVDDETDLLGKERISLALQKQKIKTYTEFNKGSQMTEERFKLMAARKARDHDKPEDANVWNEQDSIRNYEDLLNRAQSLSFLSGSGLTPRVRKPLRGSTSTPAITTIVSIEDSQTESNPGELPTIAITKPKLQPVSVSAVQLSVEEKIKEQIRQRRAQAAQQSELIHHPSTLESS